MNRQGSLIWWLVCIALVGAWVWSFNTASESSTDEMARLEQANPAPAKSDAPQLQLKKAPENVQFANPVMDRPKDSAPVLSMDMGIQDRLRQASTFDQPSQDAPFIELAETVAQRDEDISRVITNPPTLPASKETKSDSIRSAISQANRITNPFFDEQEGQSTAEPADPVLTMTATPSAMDFSQASELTRVPIEATTDPKPVQTDFANFDDLKSDQGRWNQQSFTVTPGEQFVSGKESEMSILAPIGPRDSGTDASTIQQCVNHIEYGKSLARRGAAFAAREEFYSALRLIAQTNDVQTRSNKYTTSLRDAITALNEADDFYTDIAHDGIDVNVAHVVEAHQSRIISQVQAEGMPSVTAIQMYFEFARRRFNDAFGENVIASEALYSLGKLFTVAAAHELSGNPLDYSKSIVMHYAALDSDRNNYRSSNELGVLMARNGRLEKAKNLFRDSLVVHRMPQTWRNLSIVHERIAQSSRDPNVAAENRDLAAKASQEYELTRNGIPSMGPRVQWVTPEQFEQTAPAEFNEIRTAQAPTETSEPSAKPNLIQQFKKMF